MNKVTMYDSRDELKVFSLCLILLMLYCFTGCFTRNKTTPRAPTLHKGYEEFETIIYNELHEYIRLDEPVYDNEQKLLLLTVSFTQTYYDNDDVLAEHPMYEVIDRFMYLFNRFVEENPGYFWSGDIDYYVSFGYDTSSHFEIVATLKSFTSKLRSNKLCAVEYYFSFDFAKLTCKEDIKYVYITFSKPDIADDYEYADYICNLISVFPNLEEVNFITGGHFDREQVIKEITERYPSIIIGN